MDRDTVIALREEADNWAEQKLQCAGEFHPDFHVASDERFAAIVAAAERDRICTMLDGLHRQEERHNYYGFIRNLIREMK